jgi:hypothetical protein
LNVAKETAKSITKMMAKLVGERGMKAAVGFQKHTFMERLVSGHTQSTYHKYLALKVHIVLIHS